MIVKLLTEHNLEFLSFKGGCTGWSDSTLVEMPHCWKTHVAAHIFIAGLKEIQAELRRRAALKAAQKDDVEEEEGEDITDTTSNGHNRGLTKEGAKGRRSVHVKYCPQYYPACLEL